MAVLSDDRVVVYIVEFCGLDLTSFSAGRKGRLGFPLSNKKTTLGVLGVALAKAA